MRRPSPRWLLPATDHLIDKERTGPDLGKRRVYNQYVTEPDIFFRQIKPFPPLAAARPLTIRSWPEAINARGSRRAGRMLISRSACSLAVA